MTTYDLLGRTEVSSDASNFTIQIDARDERPEVAKQVALTMADVFVEERTAYYNQQDKRDRIEVKVVDHVIDAPLFRPKPALNAVAGLVLGAVLGGIIVFILEWLQADKLRTPQAVERYLGLPVLGTIPSAAER
jgi:capsular polysaccharide biosynthesis protein